MRQQHILLSMILEVPTHQTVKLIGRVLDIDLLYRDRRGCVSSTSAAISWLLRGALGLTVLVSLL